jgi:hypothetical protein
MEEEGETEEELVQMTVQVQITIVLQRQTHEHAYQACSFVKVFLPHVFNLSEALVSKARGIQTSSIHA